MSDEEEDVIIKNSQLYQYLKETGCDEFLNAEEDLPDVTNSSASSSSTSTETAFKHKPSFFQRLINFLNEFFHPRDDLLSLLEHHRNECLHMCLSTHLIHEDDQRFLGGYLDVALKSSAKPKPTAFLLKILGIVSSTVPFFSIWMKRRVSKFINIPSFVIGSSFLALLSYKKFLVWKEKQLCLKNVKIIAQMLSSSFKFSDSLKKSIRLVQESEIIARGFTVATVKDAIMRIENSSQESTQNQYYQCILLRRKVFSTANHLFMQTRKITKNFIDSLPLSDDIDNKSNYLASVPLNQFQLIDDLDDDPKSKALTISNLKLITERYYLQQSELLTRLLLVLYPDIIRGPLDANDKLSHIKKNIANSLLIMEKITDINTEAQNELSKSFHFHKCLLDGDDAQRKSVNFEENRKESKVQISIHSIYLHLQTALARVREFENFLEQVEEMKEANPENVTSMLNVVMNELKTCSDCVEESFLLMNHETESHEEITEIIKDKNADATKSQSSVLPWTCQEASIGDPRIEEEVFEGIVEKYQEEYRHMNYDELSQQMNKKKQEMEHAVKLYRELKSVLKLRASDTQQKEELTLQKFKDDISGNKLQAQDFENELSDCNSVKTVPKILPESDASHIGHGTSKKPEYNLNLTEKDTLNQNISDQYNVPSSSLSFSANVAAMAAAKSQSLGFKTLVTEEFIDDDESE